MTGPEGSSAGVPRSSLIQSKGTPNRITLSKPFFNQRANKFLQSVNTPSALPRQCRDLYTSIRIIGDEYRVHEHGLGKLAFCLPFSREWVGVSTLEDRRDIHIFFKKMCDHL